MTQQFNPKWHERESTGAAGVGIKGSVDLFVGRKQRDSFAACFMTRAVPSASSAEKSASLPGHMQGDTTPKLRSCLVCRSRKVRCDKQSPCSNCRRANIACVVPSKDRPPRWPRRLDRPATDEVMERLQTLESLVRELRRQLEPSKIDTGPATGASSGTSSLERVDHERGTHHKANSAVTISENVQKQFERLVRQGDRNSSYLGNGFWSRVNDEIQELKVE